jgi:hypothetical protein
VSDERNALVPQALVGEVTSATFQSLAADVIANRRAGGFAEDFVEMACRNARGIGNALHGQSWIAQVIDNVQARAREMLCGRAVIARIGPSSRRARMARMNAPIV